MTVNDRVLEIINSRKGLTQKSLGDALGLPSSSVSNWLKTGHAIPTKYIIPIAEYLCVSPMYLLTGEDEYNVISEEDSDWLSVLHQMPEEFRGTLYDMMVSYLKDHS